jgi:glycosyltransferase involved in cell wall biosynthesis
VSEVVEDGVSGTIVPAEDPPALAAATVRLLEDEQLRLRLGKAGRQRAAECYSPEALVERHMEAFRAATGQGRR